MHIMGTPKVTTALISNVEWDEAWRKKWNEDQLIIVGCSDGSIVLYAPGNPMQRARVHKTVSIRALALNKKSQVLAAGVERSATVFLFSIDVRRTEVTHNAGYFLHETPFGEVPCGDSMDDLKRRAHTLGHTAPVTALCFSQKSGDCLVSGGEDSTIRFWSLRRTRSRKSSHTSLRKSPSSAQPRIQPLKNGCCCCVIAAPAMSIQSVFEEGDEHERFGVGLADGSFELFTLGTNEPIYRFDSSSRLHSVSGHQSLWQMRSDMATWLGYNARSETLSLFGPRNSISFKLPYTQHHNEPALGALQRYPGLSIHCAFSWEPELWKIFGGAGRGLVDCLGILTSLGQESTTSLDQSTRYIPVAHLVMKHQEARGSVAELRIEKAPLVKPFSPIDVPHGTSIVLAQSFRTNPLRDIVWPYCERIKPIPAHATGSENTFWTCDDIVMLYVLSNGDIVLSSASDRAMDVMLKRLRRMPSLCVRGA